MMSALRSASPARGNPTAGAAGPRAPPGRLAPGVRLTSGAPVALSGISDGGRSVLGSASASPEGRVLSLSSEHQRLRSCEVFSSPHIFLQAPDQEAGASGLDPLHTLPHVILMTGPGSRRLRYWSWSQGWSVKDGACVAPGACSEPPHSSHQGRAGGWTVTKPWAWGLSQPAPRALCSLAQVATCAASGKVPLDLLAW